MPKLLEVRPLPGYTLALRYADGSEGTVDVSEFAGRGVFALWNDVSAFEAVQVGSFGQLVWSDEVELCADALYLRLTRQAPEDVFPNLREMTVHA